MTKCQEKKFLKSFVEYVKEKFMADKERMIDNEKIKAIIKQYADKGKKMYSEAVESRGSRYNMGFWDGYECCAKGLLRELEDMQEEPTIPDIVDEHFYEMLGEELANEDLTNEIRKVVIENLFACTEPSELKKERVIEIANEITPFVVKVAKEFMLKDSVDAECSTLLYANGDEVRYAVQYPKGQRPVERGDKVKIFLIKE